MFQKKKKEEVNLGQFLALQEELQELQAENPEFAPGYKKNLFERFGARYAASYDRRHQKHPVQRSTYLWLCLLGAFGAHHFYANHKIRGAAYLAFCWTGIPIGLTFIDWIEAFPLGADETGRILI